MKRHNVSFLIAVIFIVAAFVAKYYTIKEGVPQGGDWVKVIIANKYWLLFIGGAVFAFLGSREYNDYTKRKNGENEKGK